MFIKNWGLLLLMLHKSWLTSWVVQVVYPIIYWVFDIQYGGCLESLPSSSRVPTIIDTSRTDLMNPMSLASWELGRGRKDCCYFRRFVIDLRKYGSWYLVVSSNLNSNMFIVGIPIRQIFQLHVGQLKRQRSNKQGAPQPARLRFTPSLHLPRFPVNGFFDGVDISTYAVERW